MPSELDREAHAKPQIRGIKPAKLSQTFKRGFAMRNRNRHNRATRCVDGRTMRHDPQPDDPGLETDIGKCPECNGKGCDQEEDTV